MKLFEFGAFQNIIHMASREKYIFHTLFGAFHDTPRMRAIVSDVLQIWVQGLFLNIFQMLMLGRRAI